MQVAIFKPLKNPATDAMLTICPPSRFLSKLLIICTGARQLTQMLFLASAMLLSSKCLGNTIPALFTSTSILGYFCLIQFIVSSIWAEFDRSHLQNSARLPAACNSYETFLNKSFLMSIIISRHPYFLANIRAVCLPIPIHAPVINTFDQAVSLVGGLRLISQ